MKRKLPFLISISCLLAYKLLQYATGSLYIALTVFLIPIGILSANLILRKKLSYKSWFLSKQNIFLEKEISVFESDISKELLFEKVLEVVKSSSFDFIDLNANSYELLLSTTPNFWTWGENLYIEIEEGADSISKISVTGVTVFGNYSWNRNRSNFQHFHESFQQSLTI